MKSAVQSLIRSLSPRLRAVRRDATRKAVKVGSEHHWVFDHFPSFDGFVSDEFSPSFIGSLIRGEFGAFAGQPVAGRVKTALPTFDEEYFEWIDLLEAARAAGETFTYLELGAGYGRWSVCAAIAAKHLGKNVRLGLAEAMPKHVAFLHQHMADNGVSPDTYRVYENAVDDRVGESVFCVHYPPDGPNSYGQALLAGVVGAHPQVGEFFGLPLYEFPGGAQVVMMPTIPLSQIIADFDFVDLADFDLQGAEARAIEEALPALTAKVRRMHVETHTAEVEETLRKILPAEGWVCLRDFSLQKEQVTPFGPIWFGCGVQSWINPRLL